MRKNTSNIDQIVCFLMLISASGCAVTNPVILAPGRTEAMSSCIEQCLASTYSCQLSDYHHTQIGVPMNDVRKLPKGKCKAMSRACVMTLCASYGKEIIL